MEEKDYKKLYEDVVALAKDGLKDGLYLSRSAKDVTEFLFPQLKETKDEKMRRELTRFLINFNNGYYSRPSETEIDSWIKWIDKKCEKKSQGKSALEVWKDMRFEVYQQASGNRHEPNCSDDSTKMFSINDIDEIFEKVAEKQGEQKPVECIKFDNEFENQISHLIASVLNGEHEYDEGFVKYASQSLLGFAKKEQKPADIDKNSAMSEALRTEYEKGRADAIAEMKKSTWSEEDERMLALIINEMESIKSNSSTIFEKNIAQEKIDWLKSLKHQPNQYDKGYEDGYSAAKYNNWKPTKKQMEDFRMLLDYNIGVFDYGKFMSVNSLYDDLKENLID